MCSSDLAFWPYPLPLGCGLGPEGISEREGAHTQAIGWTVQPPRSFPPAPPSCLRQQPLVFCGVWPPAGLLPASCPHQGSPPAALHPSVLCNLVLEASPLPTGPLHTPPLPGFRVVLTLSAALQTWYRTQRTGQAGQEGTQMSRPAQHRALQTAYFGLSIPRPQPRWLWGAAGITGGSLCPPPQSQQFPSAPNLHTPLTASLPSSPKTA